MAGNDTGFLGFGPVRPSANPIRPSSTSSTHTTSQPPTPTAGPRLVDCPPGLGFGGAPAPITDGDSLAGALASSLTLGPADGSSLPISRQSPFLSTTGRMQYTASIDVPADQHGFLFGKQGAKKKEIETASRCQLFFPNRQSALTQIRVVSTVGESCVDKALGLIQEAVNEAREQRAGKTATHFVAIPVTYSVPRQRFITFADCVMTSECSEDSMKLETYFPSDRKLHMTICQVRIESNEEVAAAYQALSLIKCRQNGRKLVHVKIQDLTTTDDHEKTHILMAKMHGDGLQELADFVREEFQRAGLLAGRSLKRGEMDRPVQLQLVVMNSRYAAQAETDSKDVVFAQRKPFNIKSFMAHHGEFDFGGFDLDKVVVCEFGTEDEETGFYKVPMETFFKAGTY